MVSIQTATDGGSKKGNGGTLLEAGQTADFDSGIARGLLKEAEQG